MELVKPEITIVFNDGISSSDVQHFLMNQVLQKLLRAYKLSWQPTEVVEETDEYTITKKYKGAFLSKNPVKEMDYLELYILKDVETGQKFNFVNDSYDHCTDSHNVFHDEHEISILERLTKDFNVADLKVKDPAGRHARIVVPAKYVDARLIVKRTRELATDNNRSMYNTDVHSASGSVEIQGETNHLFENILRQVKAKVAKRPKKTFPYCSWNEDDPY